MVAAAFIPFVPTLYASSIAGACAVSDALSKHFEEKRQQKSQLSEDSLKHLTKDEAAISKITASTASTSEGEMSDEDTFDEPWSPIGVEDPWKSDDEITKKTKRVQFAR